MAEIVTSDNEVSINAVRYPLIGNIQRSLSSNYPEKTIIGDYTKDSSPILSVLALSDHRGGIGLDIMASEKDTNRSWYSTADTRFQGHLILPPLVTNTGSLPAGLTATHHLMAYTGNLFANVDATTDGVYGYTPGTDSWGSNLISVTLAATNGQFAYINIAGIPYLAFGVSGAYIYYSGGSWSTRTAASTGGRMVGFANRVWGVDMASSTSKLWYTFTPGSAEVFMGATPLSESFNANSTLFAARDAAGEMTLYQATSTGLFVYDMDNDKWLPTGLQIPDNAASGTTVVACGVVWRDDIYFACNSSIFKYSLSSGQAIVTLIGPDRDHGLPSAKGGTVLQMVASLNDIIVSLYTTAKTSVIMAWNGQGWRVLYEGGAALGESLQPLLVAGTAGGYRLWFANNTTSPYNISYISLPSSVINPLQITTYTYASAATHDWPWFTAGQSDVTKVAVRVKVETKNPTTSETVILSYATDWVESFTAFTTITTAGITTFNFPNSTTPTGTSFRAIRFRAALARGGTNTNTPDVLSVSLEYYKKLDPKYQFIVALDLTQEYKGNTPRALRTALLAAQESATLMEFTYHDVGNDTDATFYVQVRPQQSEEETGLSERGKGQFLLVEV